MEKLLSRAMFWTSFWALLFPHTYQQTSQNHTLSPHTRIHNHISQPSPIQPSNPKQTQMQHSLPRVHLERNLPQTLTNPKNPINQQPIRGALDLKIPKERIRPIQAQYLVQRIVLLAVLFGREVRGEGGEREGVCGPAGLGAEGEEGEVAYYWGGGGGEGVGVED
jgi:hypothetical protein